jgi:hypothetical protein
MIETMMGEVPPSASQLIARFGACNQALGEVEVPNLLWTTGYPYGTIRNTYLKQSCASSIGVRRIHLMEDEIIIFVEPSSLG